MQNIMNIFVALVVAVFLTAPAAAAVGNTSGPWGISVSGFTSFAAATGAAVTSGKTVVVDKTVTVTATQTVTGRTISIPRGGRIDVSDGLTLTMPFPISGDGSYRIFGGSGTVLFSTPGVVTPQMWGAVGDGVTDDTAAILAAIAAARNGKGTLHFPYGAAGRYVFNPTVTVVLTGIQRVTADNVTLDATAATAVTLFSVTGSKTLLGSAKTIGNNSEAITLASVAGLSKGDTILILSNQDHPNKNLTYNRNYKLGTRTYVDYVDTANKKVFVYPNVDWAYTSSAYVYKVNPARIIIESGLTVMKAQETPGIGITISYADADIASEWDNFGNAGVLYRASTGRFTGKTNDNYYVGTGNSYGVSIADLSSVAVVGAHCRGARHAVAAGGGGFFDGADYGGTPGDATASFPPDYTVSGGTYASSRSSADILNDPSSGQGAIDAHGIARSATVTGATIYGGVSMGALNNTVTGNTIHYGTEPGYTAKDTYSTSYTSHLITGNTFIKDIPSANATSDSPIIAQQVLVMDSVFSCNKLVFADNLVNNMRNDTSTNNDSIASVNGTVQSLDISGNHFESNNLVANGMNFYVSVRADDTMLTISGNRLKNVGFYVQAIGLTSATTARLVFSNNYGVGSVKNVALTTTLTSGEYELVRAVISNNTLVGYEAAVVAYSGVKNVNLIGNVFSNCVTATYLGAANFYTWGSGSTKGVKRLLAYDNDFYSTNGLQKRGLSFIGIGTGDSVKVYWRGNRAGGNIGSPSGQNYAYFNTAGGITVIDEGHNDLTAIE